VRVCPWLYIRVCIWEGAYGASKGRRGRRFVGDEEGAGGEEMGRRPEAVGAALIEMCGGGLGGRKRPGGEDGEGGEGSVSRGERGKGRRGARHLQIRGWAGR
jgi:hypothetical protein